MRTVKTKTALRAWRRSIQLLAVVIAMYYAASVCSIGFAVVMLAALYAVWWLGRCAIVTMSRRGRLRLDMV